MKKQRSILICGASIAGPCLAFWLNRAGFKTTIIERSTKFRDGGQNIDVKGAGDTIVGLMGLKEEIRARSTNEKGLRFVDASGAKIAEFPKEGSLSITQELEISRGDLARVFFDATKDLTTYRFGLSIKSLVNKANSIRAEFSDGTSKDYDLIVSAEGVGSATRKLIMSEFVKFKYLGLWMAFFRVPKIATDDHWARWSNSVGGRAILMRPATSETESVCVDFVSKDSSVDHRPLAEQRKTIREVLKNAGWQADRIAKNLDYDDDLYMGPLSQVKASQWSKGRFVLVGDAAYAPSPVTGMGTTLAIAGAYVLAGELSKNDNVIDALAVYERVLRPFVERSQQLPPGVPGLAHPKSKIGIAIFNNIMRIAGSQPVQKILQLTKRGDNGDSVKDAPDGFVLPTYKF